MHRQKNLNKTDTMKRLAILAAAVSLLAACAQTQEAPKGALDTIFSRKSVRSYTSEPVSSEQTEILLKAAMSAPTGMNVQPWRFVVVTDDAVKEALAGPRGKMIRNAPLVVVVCGETTIMRKPSPEATEEVRMDNPNWTADCAAATENLLLAAEALDLGAVWTACYPYPERMSQTISALGLPEGVTPYCIVPIGHPDGDNQPKDKWKPENIHYNKW